jgi:hypothetical protein
MTMNWTRPFVYLAAWVYFHAGMLYRGLKKTFLFLATHRIKFDIHTFIGAGLAVWYYLYYTGKLPDFHGFHDALPALSEHAGLRPNGTGYIILISVASVLLITLARGPLVFIGYMLAILSWVIFTAFETPGPLSTGV